MHKTISKAGIIAIMTMFYTTSIATEKICFVNSKEEADKIITIVESKEMADQIIYITKDKGQSGDNVWIITEQNSADIKVFISKEGVGEKTYFSKTLIDKTL